MTPEKYRDEEKLTYSELAERLGITLAMAYRICKGTHCVGLKAAHSIVQKSGGKIWYSDLLESLNC